MPLVPLGFFAEQGQQVRISRVGFAEIYWADIPRHVVNKGDTLEETKAWGKSALVPADQPHPSGALSRSGRGRASPRREPLPALKRAHLLRLSHTRIVALHLRARAALAAAPEAPTGERRRERVALARQLARKLDREDMPWASALGALIVAGADQMQGQLASITRVAALRGQLERTELKLFRAALDSACPDAAPSATAGLAPLGVRNPKAFAQMLVPGLVLS